MEEQAHLGQHLGHDRVQPRAPGHRHDGAVEVLVGGSPGFIVTGCRSALAFLDRGPDGGHILGAAPAAHRADLDRPPDRVDVVDVVSPQAGHEDAAVGVPDHQPLTGQFRKGFPDCVP